MTAEALPYPNEPEDAYVLRDTDEVEDFVERGASIPFNIDPVRSYLQQIGRTPLVNAEQEVELSKRIEAGLYAGHLLAKREAGTLEADSRGDEEYWQDLLELAEDGSAAKTHLLEANLRLVVSIAKRYTRTGIPFLDLIQEGNTGLNRAVEKFDYAKGYKFSTYATWWIRQSITRAMADTGRIIRIPVHMNERLNKFTRVQREMIQDLGREATPAELAVVLKVPEKTIHEYIEYARLEPSSLNKPVGLAGGGQPDTEFGDLIPDTSRRPAHEEYERTELRESLEQVFDTLSEQEAAVIRMRYGIEDGNSRTLEAIGQELGYTRERIRQIEQKAMAKLRTPQRNKALRVFLDNS